MKWTLPMLWELLKALFEEENLEQTDFEEGRINSAAYTASEYRHIKEGRLNMRILVKEMFIERLAELLLMAEWLLAWTMAEYWPRRQLWAKDKHLGKIERFMDYVEHLIDEAHDDIDRQIQAMNQGDEAEVWSTAQCLRFLGWHKTDKTNWLDEDNPDKHEHKPYNTSHWNGVWDKGERWLSYVKAHKHQMTAKDLISHNQRLKFRRKRYELDFVHYVLIKIEIEGRLWEITGNERCKAECNNLVDIYNKQKLGERENTSPIDKLQEMMYDDTLAPNERVFGPNGIPNEDAMVRLLDYRAMIADIAAKRGVSMEQAFDDLQREED